MRWLVEVMTLGKTETESLHVDGESWQKALQAAREKRGESAPMSGFSIELSDDGCRAVDSMSRLRYDVRRVPEAAAAPSPPSAPPAPFPLAEPEAPSRAPDAAPAPQPLQAAQPPRPTSQPPRATKRPSLSPSAAAVMLGPAAAGATRPAPAPVVPVAAAAAAPAPAVADIPSQVIFKREEDATDSVPLTYREYVFLVPVGTSEKAAEALLRSQLELVRASLLRSPAGKLVNLGVFDVAFQGKPPVPPLSTLMWKDWRDDPVIEFPRRPGYKRRPASVPPTDTATRPKVVSPPLDQPAPASAPPPAASQPATRAADTHVPAPAAMVVPAPVAAVAAAAVPATALADGSPPAVVPAPAPREVPAPSTPAPREVPAPSTPAPREVPTPAPREVPTPSTPAPREVPAHAPPDAMSHAQPDSLAPQSRPRAPGDELIADLFESMHELHFLRDAVEGGDFCLGLAMERIPSHAGIVHLYDIDRREFLVTSTRGVAASTLLLRRYPEGDPLLSSAMGKGRALVLADATHGEAASLDRYVGLGGVRSVIVAPVMVSGRFLGAIELLNPLDGQPYTEAEGNAVTYIAEQFAEFVESHGIVTDPQRIGSRVK